jgi:hypothetical protein
LKVVNLFGRLYGIAAVGAELHLDYSRIANLFKKKIKVKGTGKLYFH